MANTFQSLLSSPSVKLYAPEERKNLSIFLDSSYFMDTIIPAAIRASELHVARRAEAVLRKLGSSDTVALTVEALSDPHFRKQPRFGPEKAEISDKVRKSLEAREQIHLVGMMFTRKNICPLKRCDGDESVCDMAEIISFIHLNAFASLVFRFYPHGVSFTVLSEGTRFLKAFDLCEPLVRMYQKRIRDWVTDLGLAHMRLVDYEDFLSSRITESIKQMRNEEYETALRLYRSLMLPALDLADMPRSLELAVACDPVKDVRNGRNNFVPLWDSVKNSLPYAEIRRFADARGMAYEAAYRDIFSDIMTPRGDAFAESVRRSVILKSWNAAIEHNARVMGDTKAGVDVGLLVSTHAFRTSINPKPGSHLGIYAVRETTSRVQPWHGIAYITTDASSRLIATVLSKLEIEGRNGIPVVVEGMGDSPFFYVDRHAAELLRTRGHISFNMATRDVNSRE